jgi:glutamyl-tRNA synthetase
MTQLISRTPALMAVPGRESIRVRFAPNGEIPFPGFIVRTVLYSWLFARHFSGTFILRLDDTDVDRQVPGALQSYPDGLRWLGLGWDEGPEVGGSYGPYRQSQRFDYYGQAIEKLIDDGHAYRCYCSAARLAFLAKAARQPGVRQQAYDGHCRDASRSDIEAAKRDGRQPAIRMRVPAEGTITSYDLLRGPITIAAAQLSDFVICRPDGWATYHLTVVVDDALMRISHVIRGAEGLSNMAPQAIVHQALGLDVPHYLHHPLVRTPGFTVSERFLPDGSLIYVDELRAAGVPAEAVLNYYYQLGYGAPDGDAMHTLDALVERFDYSRISRKDFVNQSLDKLSWMSGKYLRSVASDQSIAELIRQRLLDSGVGEPQAADLAERSAPIVRRRLKRADEIPGFLHFAVTPPEPVSVDPQAARWAVAAADALDRGEDAAGAVRGLAGGDADLHRQITRSLLALLGAADTPFSLNESAAVLGAETAIERWRVYAT